MLKILLKTPHLVSPCKLIYGCILKLISAGNRINEVSQKLERNCGNSLKLTCNANYTKNIQKEEYEYLNHVVTYTYLLQLRA